MGSIKISSSLALPRTSFRKYSSVGVLMDENTRQHCYDLARPLLPEHHCIEVPSGEENKNLDTSKIIWQELTVDRFDRHSLLVILGGGVLGDMGGFCAATFKRGIDFLMVPTTLLAQVDSSVGGKLAIDFGPFKNHIGVFQQPVATYIAIEFLKTLPPRELRSGFAEVIKHCLISDKKMWETIRKKPLADQSWLPLVKHSVAFKEKVVKKDPREGGLRKILNFGHTLGHALEGHFLQNRNRLFHGEAIAAGMVMEAYIASKKRLLGEKDLGIVTEYILSVFGKITPPDAGTLLPIMGQDKKNKGNKILLALPDDIGKAVWDIPVSEKEVRDSIDYYQSQT